MIHSMTGFGKAANVFNDKKITVEIKSLNSKQIDFAVKIPQNYREIEMDLRANVAKSLLRGKIDLYLTCEPIDGSSSIEINGPVLANYKTQLEQLASSLHIDPPSDWYATLLRLPDALKNESRNSQASAEELQAVKTLTQEAIQQLIAFRSQEGLRLEHFFEEKIAAISQLLDEVPKYEQTRVEKIKNRMIDAFSQIKEVDYDQNRLEQELIFYIEKLDITEEKLRLHNHLTYFLDTLHASEPGQGKKLGFIAQEMGREINTLGSKANQADLQKLVVLMKDHLEQIKEQVLNVL